MLRYIARFGLSTIVTLIIIFGICKSQLYAQAIVQWSVPYLTQIYYRNWSTACLPTSGAMVINYFFSTGFLYVDDKWVDNMSLSDTYLTNGQRLYAKGTILGQNNGNDFILSLSDYLKRWPKNGYVQYYGDWSDSWGPGGHEVYELNHNNHWDGTKTLTSQATDNLPLGTTNGSSTRLKDILSRYFLYYEYYEEGSIVRDDLLAAIERGPIILGTDMNNVGRHIIVLTGKTESGNFIANDPWGNNAIDATPSKDGKSVEYSYDFLNPTWGILVPIAENVDPSNPNHKKFSPHNLICESDLDFRYDGTGFHNTSYDGDGEHDYYNGFSYGAYSAGGLPEDPSTGWQYYYSKSLGAWLTCKTTGSSDIVTNSATWEINVTKDGIYRLETAFYAMGDNASKVPYQIFIDDRKIGGNIIIDQSKNDAGVSGYCSKTLVDQLVLLDGQVLAVSVSNNLDEEYKDINVDLIKGLYLEPLENNLVGRYQDGWHDDWSSQAIYQAYIRNGGIDVLGNPCDNGPGEWVHEYTFVSNGNSVTVNLQDFSQDESCGDDHTTISYLPGEDEAYLLKGCIGCIWWKYKNLLGAPVSDEIEDISQFPEKEQDDGFDVMQIFQIGKVFWDRETERVRILSNIGSCEEDNQNTQNQCLPCSVETPFLTSQRDELANEPSADTYPSCTELNLNSGLDNGPWPMYGHDTKHTARSSFTGFSYPMLKWRHQVSHKGDRANSPIIGGDGTIYFSVDNDNVASYALYALNKDGSVKWTYGEGLKTNCTPAIASDGTVYIAIQSALHAINPDGSPKWTCETGGSLYVGSSPAIGPDGMIYISAYYIGATLYAINPSGEIEWQAYSGYGWASSPVIDNDGTIYVGAYDRFNAFYPEGTLKWSYGASWLKEFSSPSIASDGTIYSTAEWDNSDSYYLFAFDPDGNVNWQSKLSNYDGGFSRTCPAIGSDGTIYVGSVDSTLYTGESYLNAINPNGTPKWHYPLEWWHGTSPAVGADGTVYILDSKDYIHAINPDGSLNWKYYTGLQSYWTSPSINSDGTIHLPAGDSIFAIGLPVGKGYIYGKVADLSTGEVIVNATISAAGVNGQSDFKGSYAIELDPGVYDLICSKSGYQTITISDVEVNLGEGTELNIELTTIKDTSCYRLDSSTGIPPVGYGAAYNVLSEEKELLIQTLCGYSDVTVEVGSGKSVQFIWRQGYILNRDAWAWEPYDLTGDDLRYDNWYVGNANSTISVPPEELQDIDNFILAYICTWTGTEWKCGCRDQDCGTRYWQLQRFGQSSSTSSSMTSMAEGGVAEAQTSSVLPPPPPLPVIDSDNDGLPDDIENNSCTDPFNADSDYDGIRDGVEDANHNGTLDSGETNPCNRDTDGDGLNDGVEDANQNGIVDSGETNPRNRDTDSDGMQDGWEVQYSLNPLVDDASEDADGDGYTNIEEYRGRSDPRDENSLPKPMAMPWILLLLSDD